ncbi:S9 family peptidase [Actinomycetospora flava]|uniref:S9 family peptidase n=1 Tax=Actinomycetospora flava TaxID=3129232 RepID=A0ABU8M5R0_9PSEU
MSDLLAIEDLFALPEKARPRISPDGTRLAYLAPWKNRLNVWVQDLGPSGDLLGEGRCVTADETRSVTHYAWTDDPRWLLYTQDDGGDENHHLFRVDLDGAGGDDPAPAVDLTPFPGARVLGQHQPPGRPGTVLLQINHRRLDEMDVVEIDIATGELTVLAENPGMAWVVTPERELYALRTAEDGTLELTHARTGRLVTTFDGLDHPLGVAPFELSADGAGVWVGSFTWSDRMRLARIDLATGEETEVDGHPEHDLDAVRRAVLQAESPLIRDRHTGELLGVRYLGEKQAIRPQDPQFAAVLARLETLSDGSVGELSHDAERRRWVVTFGHDREPGVAWFYDHATGEARELFRPYPHLDREALAPMTPVTVPARDGLALPSYLSLPVGRRSEAELDPAIGVESTGLPLVLLVHGGPWMRDAWGFDPEVALLANRGYAVLQVNFRGSVGYGRAHMQAAIGEFAGAMHDDLVDAVTWAVEQGYADPARVAISGGSYGGYAALVGVTFTPHLFAAAVDYVGVSDVVNLVRSFPPFVRRELVNNFHRYVGDPDVPEQEADMRARSPIHRVDAIRTPLLVAQGANDVRVTRDQSDTVVASLRERGVDVEYLVKDNEGHGFLNPENQIDLHRATERFLARHLGGRSGER